MSGQISTKERLLSIINDMELISKEIIDSIILPKSQRMVNVDVLQLTELLIWKNDELNDNLKMAKEQAELDRKINEVKAEVDKYDQYIIQLQTKLKTAEQILSTAIFQAKQKLQSISRANKRPVSSEELIKFAHRISASNAICAPLNWQQGDPRRPYPTDIEMRLGLLGRLSDLPINGTMLQQQQQQLSEIHQRSSSSRDMTPSHSSQFAWPSSEGMHMLVGSNQSSVHTEAQNHKQESEDVEVMSTDSSSSSSSDSQ